MPLAVSMFFACCLPVDGSAVLGRQVLYYGLYLATCGQTDYYGYLTEKLELIDIGKPETLARAEEFLRENIVS